MEIYNIVSGYSFVIVSGKNVDPWAEIILVTLGNSQLLSTEILLGLQSLNPQVATLITSFHLACKTV